MTISILFTSGEHECLACRMISLYPTRNEDNEPELIIYFDAPEPSGRYNRYIPFKDIDTCTIIK